MPYIGTVYFNGTSRRYRTKSERDKIISGLTEPYVIAPDEVEVTKRSKINSQKSIILKMLAAGCTVHRIVADTGFTYVRVGRIVSVANKIKSGRG